MTLRVRSMRNDDIDRVYAIEEVAHRAPWSRQILNDCVLVNYDCRVLEIESDKELELAGYVISRYDGDICHVLNICIAPALQNKGYGQFLLQNVIDSLTKSAFGSLLLEVRPSNPAALHIYQKMGFKQTGIKRGYYREGSVIEDGIVLEKQIIGPSGTPSA